MSTQPRIEARVTALERRQLNLDARVEELAEDTTASIKQSSEDMTISFKQLSEYLTTMATKEDISGIKADIAEIKAMTATKADLTEMEGRLLDVLKQLLTTIHSQQPPSE